MVGIFSLRSTVSSKLQCDNSYSSVQLCNVQCLNQETLVKPRASGFTQTSREKACRVEAHVWQDDRLLSHININCSLFNKCPLTIARGEMVWIVNLAGTESFKTNLQEWKFQDTFEPWWWNSRCVKELSMMLLMQAKRSDCSCVNNCKYWEYRHLLLYPPGHASMH